MKKLFAGLLFALWFAVPASAQTARVVPACGTLPQSYASGSTRDLTQDVNGNACIAGSFSQTGGTVSNATDAQATTATNQGSVSYNYGFNGTTWDRLQVDASKFLKVNCTVGCSGGTFNNNADAVATSAANGQVAAWLYGFNGATYDRLQVDASKQLKVADVNVVAAINSPTPAGTNTIGTVGQLPYPVGAVPLTASATGTTAATTATLAGTAGKTTYICSLSVRANATANVNVTDTVTGVITGTLSRALWVPANTAGLGVDEMIYNPCVPASATNTAIAVVSGAPGTGGVVTVNATGYQL